MNADKHPTVTTPYAVDALEDLIKRCNVAQPSSSDLQTLQLRLDSTPDLWHALGDLSKNVENEVLNAVHGNPLLRMTMEHQLEAMKKDLVRDSDGPLEQQLVYHTALCWLRLQLAELTYTKRMEDEHKLVQVEYWDKHLAATQRRYLRACETLARIRRLALPAIQLNFAHKQLNVLSNAPDSEN